MYNHNPNWAASNGQLKARLVQFYNIPAARSATPTPLTAPKQPAGSTLASLAQLSAKCSSPETAPGRHRAKR